MATFTTFEEISAWQKARQLTKEFGHRIGDEKNFDRTGADLKLET